MLQKTNLLATNGVHPDQEELGTLTKAIKKTMAQVRICYNGADMTLWEFADFA